MRLTLLKFAMPVLMLVVIGVQVYRAQTMNQTPWKGGGFGMFSTNDHRSTRLAAIRVVVDGRELPVSLSENRKYLKEKFLGAPNEASMERLFGRLTQLEWQLHGDGKISDVKGSLGIDAIKVVPESISVEYFRLLYTEPNKLEPVSVLRKKVAL